MLGISVALIAVAALFGIEAYKARERLPRLVLTGLAVAFALWAALVKQIADLWPKLGAFVANIASNPMVWFVLFIALFFVLRPLWQKGTGAYDDSALRGEIAESDAAIEALAETVGKLDRKANDFALMLTETTRLAGEGMESVRAILASRDSWSDKINEAIAATEAVKDYARGTNDFVTTAQTEAEREQRVFVEKMETWVGNLRREIRLGFKGVDQGFAAIYARERLLDMAYDLTMVSDKLTGPSKGEPLGDWAEWQAKAADWHKAVEAWARLAEKWREGTIRRVFDAPNSEYKQEWGVRDYSIFPDHVAVHDYKTLCIMSRNFHVERKSVDQYMLSAAFERPSKKPRLGISDLKELEDENPPALPPPEVQDDQ